MATKLRRKSILCTYALLLFVLFFCFKEKCQAVEYTGELSIKNYQKESMNFKSLDVKYKFSTLMGEGLKSFAFRYLPGNEKSIILNITLKARIYSGGRNQNAYIKISPLVVEKGEWGWDVPASPSWDNFFQDSSGKFISKDKSKGFFKAGFSLTDLEVVSFSANNEKNINITTGFLNRAFRGKIEKNLDVEDWLPSGGFKKKNNRWKINRIWETATINFNPYLIMSSRSIEGWTKEWVHENYYYSAFKVEYGAPLNINDNPCEKELDFNFKFKVFDSMSAKSKIKNKKLGLSPGEKVVFVFRFPKGKNQSLSSTRTKIDIKLESLCINKKKNDPFWEGTSPEKKKVNNDGDFWGNKKSKAKSSKDEDFWQDKGESDLEKYINEKELKKQKEIERLAKIEAEKKKRAELEKKQKKEKEIKLKGIKKFCRGVDRKIKLCIEKECGYEPRYRLGLTLQTGDCDSECKRRKHRRRMEKEENYNTSLKKYELCVKKAKNICKVEGVKTYEDCIKKFRKDD